MIKIKSVKTDAELIGVEAAIGLRDGTDLYVDLDLEFEIIDGEGFLSVLNFGGILEVYPNNSDTQPSFINDFKGNSLARLLDLYSRGLISFEFMDYDPGFYSWGFQNAFGQQIQISLDVAPKVKLLIDFIKLLVEIVLPEELLEEKQD